MPPQPSCDSIRNRTKARWKSAKPEPVNLRRRLRKQRGPLGLAVWRTNALERVEDHLIAALALIRWKIAFEHRAVRAKRLDAGFDIGAPRGGALFRRRRLRPQVEIEAEQAHRKPAEFDHDVGAFCELLDRRLPDWKSLLAFSREAADADRAAAMVEHDSGVGKGARKVGQFADLRMKQPGVKTQAERREAGKALAKIRIEQQTLRPRRIHAGDC